MEPMTLIELEEQLKRMREQNADDDTPIRVAVDIYCSGLREVKVIVTGGNMGKRIVELIG